ncbi:MAG: sugar ABC transporter permease [Ktedonobacteraceae bacterium]|nr:sugar ABC transporter permease [Ktedonobacteraceae bacterium]
MAILAVQKTSASPRGRQRNISWLAWIWVGPALVLELVFFIYPVLNTVWLSFFNKTSTMYVGLRNYQRIFTDPSLLEVLRNNLIWLVLATVLTVGLGLLVAVLIDRVKIERVIKSALFLPMAISFVSASVIWRFVFVYQPANQPQIGLLNAILGLFGIGPQVWLLDTRFNTFAMIAVYVWMMTGFCMVILSAALKSIPDEILEAAKMDGAGRFTIFWRIMVPMISATLTVVTVTMVINILKIFDIVYVMTGGNYHSSVVGVEFYNQLFVFGNYGQAGALAVLLMMAVVPVMYFNIRQIRQQEKMR